VSVCVCVCVCECVCWGRELRDEKGRRETEEHVYLMFIFVLLKTLYGPDLLKSHSFEVFCPSLEF
jgi:hypothetical protein